MQFIKAEATVGEAKLSESISHYLSQNVAVLWLISGGSNIPIVVQTMAKVNRERSHLLTVMLADERYGEKDNPDSNAYQLKMAGFDPKKARFVPVLSGRSLEETTDQYSEIVEKECASHKVIIGQLGIGADGHTAGILPHSPAANETQKLVTSYRADDYTRITVTFPVLRLITTAFVFAYGPTKQPALRKLQTEVLSPDVQPAQILKAIASTYIYNDELEGVVSPL
jgi:6-phosphogluconolactonase/glucosamine-6-phosphate isomerase/deaminase